MTGSVTCKSVLFERLHGDGVEVLRLGSRYAEA